jgi:hypothetical protein
MRINFREIELTNLKISLINFLKLHNVSGQIFTMQTHEIMIFENILLSIYKFDFNYLSCYASPFLYLSRLTNLLSAESNLSESKLKLIIIMFILRKLKQQNENFFNQEFRNFVLATSQNLNNFELIISEKKIIKLELEESDSILRFYLVNLKILQFIKKVYSNLEMSNNLEYWIQHEYEKHLECKINSKLNVISQILNFVKEVDFHEFYFKILLSLRYYECNYHLISSFTFQKYANIIFTKHDFTCN